MRPGPSQRSFSVMNSSGSWIGALVVKYVRKKPKMVLRFRVENLSTAEDDDPLLTADDGLHWAMGAPFESSWGASLDSGVVGSLTVLCD